MQTDNEQREANLARKNAYYRRCGAWLREQPAQFKDRIRELDARYCKGLALRRLWRTLWRTPSTNIIHFQSGPTP